MCVCVFVYECVNVCLCFCMNVCTGGVSADPRADVFALYAFSQQVGKVRGGVRRGARVGRGGGLFYAS